MSRITNIVYLEDPSQPRGVSPRRRKIIHRAIGYPENNSLAIPPSIHHVLREMSSQLAKK